MVKPRRLDPQPLFDLPALTAFFEAGGHKPLHIGTIWRHALRRRGEPLGACGGGVPRRLLEELSQRFAVTTSSVQRATTSADGSVTKLLVRLQDGHEVETVILRHGPENGSPKPRTTLCISSQVGCQMGCRFCATGTLGIIGNLHAGEILEQVFHATGTDAVTAVVFMGEGEPLMNGAAVVQACAGLTDRRLFSLAAAKVTVSTVGVIPRMRSLAQDAPGVQLALSLHAPTQELREAIVPSAGAYPLPKLIAAAVEFTRASGGQRVFVEYVLLRDVNDRPEHARATAELLHAEGGCFSLNLIPYNPTDVPEDYRPPLREDVLAFQRIVKESGIACTVRKEMGQDVAAACGQLVVQAAKERAAGASSADIEDLGLRARRAPRSSAAAPAPAPAAVSAPAQAQGRLSWTAAALALVAIAVATWVALAVLHRDD